MRSILHFDGSRYRVGPDSAGADPGPACYRHGGPLTVTDCNVMLGKLAPAVFPNLFGDAGDQAPSRTPFHGDGNSVQMGAPPGPRGGGESVWT